ncbi:MAG: ABC transporter ATP-binding protein [Tissierellia bacterium]|nr:ABC transporter ATP-binding protein [Tissierellia bacterium]
MSNQEMGKIKIINPSIKRLARELKAYYLPLLIAIIFSIVSSLLFALAPGKLSQITDLVSQAIDKGTRVDLVAVKSIAKNMLILALIAVTILYVQTFILATVSNRFAGYLRLETNKKINRLPLNFFDKNSVGDILSRLTNDIDTISQSLNQSIGWMLNSLALLLGVIVLMFYTDVTLAITAISSSLIGLFLVFIIVKKSQYYLRIKQKSLGDLNGHIEEVYSGLNVVKAYNGQEESIQKFNRYNNKLYKAVRKSQFYSANVIPLMNLTGSLGFLTVAIVGAFLVLKNRVSFGVVVEFIVYARMFSNPISQIANAINALQSTSAASERVFEFFDQEELQDESHKTIDLDLSKIKGNIEFEKVDFAYPDSKVQTIKNFSASIKAGQKIAIVGPTGAGKTTLVNLLMRFYEISSGQIIIDGIDIKDLTRAQVHDFFTMVLQDTWLFEASIYDNLVFNMEGVSRDEVVGVCKSLGLDHFINTLPKGYDSLVTNGDISAGEMQLMTIARGIIKDAPFLILDEATSNVDTRTEKIVQKAMEILAKGKTSFIIAHRLSTIRNADLILFIKDGSIVEQGKHDELMRKKGDYYEMYQSQFIQ